MNESGSAQQHFAFPQAGMLETGSMLRIGMVHYITGGTDGVSLEMDKWRRVLEDAGHSVWFCSGCHSAPARQGTETSGEFPITCSKQPAIDEISHDGCRAAQRQPLRHWLIPELDYHREEVQRLNRGTFVSLEDFSQPPPEPGTARRNASSQDKAGSDDPQKRYRREMNRQVEVLSARLTEWIETCRLDMVIVENIWSVAVHPAAAAALADAVTKRPLKILAHHHDFYWERIDGFSLTCPAARHLVQQVLPPSIPGMQHVVINSLARDELYRRTGIHASVVPNVFDFSGPDWKRSAENTDFRKHFGLLETDLILLQATRVVPRKGIELAIDLTSALMRGREQLNQIVLRSGERFSPESRIVLLLAGHAKDDTTGTYLARLMQKSRNQGIMLNHIGAFLGAERSARTPFTLWDAYGEADLVTYPSYWEGWGNQLLEAFRARLPIVLFEYPVYRADIGPCGCTVISLGAEYRKQPGIPEGDGLITIHPELIEKAAAEVTNLLRDRERYEEAVTGNFLLARRRFSLEALKQYLYGIFNAWS